MSGPPPGRWAFETRPLIADPPLNGDPLDLESIDLHRPTWIFWDVGLTLIHPSGSMVRRELEAHFPGGSWRPAEVVSALISAAEARHLRSPRGLTGDDRVQRAWAGLLGVPPEAGARVLAECLARPELYCEIDPAAPAILGALVERGVRMGVISNSDGTLGEELAHFGLASYFDVVVDSARTGVEKPRPAIFRSALNAAGVRPEDAWHVGDGLINDYLGARAVGMGAILLDRHHAWDSALPVPRIVALEQILELPAFA